MGNKECETKTTDMLQSCQSTFDFSDVEGVDYSDLDLGYGFCLSLSTFLSPEQMGEGKMKMLHRVSLTCDISNLEIH